jgi:hypothetical protein
VSAPAVCVTVPVPPEAEIAYGLPEVPDPVIVIFVLAEISPLIVVTVAAFPVVFWFHVGTLPVSPLYGIAVAVILPLPEALRDDPVPMTIAAVVFVLPVSAENAVLAELEAEIVYGLPSVPVPVIVTFEPCTNRPLIVATVPACPLVLAALLGISTLSNVGN